jgi:thiamine biosynthesis protein ThiI
MSGGIDSPVAAARAMRIGWDLYPIHFSMAPVTGPEAQERTVAGLRHFVGMQGAFGENMSGHLDRTLVVVPVAKIMAKFTEPWCHSEYFIHMKRVFNTIATYRAKEVGASHLLTGENLGQVSSQTLGNLGAVEEVTELGVLRPLLGFDKSAITDMARALGTYELSIGHEVCDALGPKHTTTVGNREWLERSEARVGGLEALAMQAWSSRTTVSL